MCEPVRLRANCYNLRARCIAAIAAAWRLVKRATAAAAREPVWLRMRCCKLSLKRITAIAVARRLVVESVAAAAAHELV